MNMTGGGIKNEGELTLLSSKFQDKSGDKKQDAAAALREQKKLEVEDVNRDFSNTIRDV